MSRTIVGIFDNYNYAENAAKQIKDQGLRTADISIVAKQQEHAGDDYKPSALFNSSPYNVSNVSGYLNPMKGALAGTDDADTNTGAHNDNISNGVVTGGVLGGLAGLLIGAGSMVVPGLGIVAAAGPITGLLSGVVTGGIVGGLVDLGIPENRSRQYETDIKAGKILFSMKTDDDKVDQVASILRNNGAVSIDSY